MTAADDPNSRRPGWYSDPSNANGIRWYDGTIWTHHSVEADEPFPDVTGQQSWSDIRPEDRRWRRPFATRDLMVPRGPEAAASVRGGYGVSGTGPFTGIGARAGVGGPLNPARWLAALTVVLAFLAWGDHRRHWLFVVAGALCLVSTVVAQIRAVRERARWKKVGQEG